MDLKEVIVTLYRKEDLEGFYVDMQKHDSNGKEWIPDRQVIRAKKRNLSRNTHYYLTESEAFYLKNDPRVWDTAPVENFEIRRQVNNEPYTVSGGFFKNAPPASTINSNMRQWGHLHCAGNQAQRRKNTWGDPTSTEVVNDSVEVFNNGKHVDVVIVDDPVSYDSGEWLSPSTGQSRFVQYQWFNELNSLVNSIDDDNQSEPTGNITYAVNAATPQFHGIHVTGTACGQHYGWANEANIYNMAVTDTWVSGQSIPSLLIFDYLRAFHRKKPVNPETGYKNPTITNHSYGGIYNYEQPFDFIDLNAVTFRGTTYNSSNPGPSGWTQAGVEQDFGVRFGGQYFPAWSSAVAADVQDAIEEGIVIIGAAGNDNLLMAEVNDQDWNNTISVANFFTLYYNRGAWPNSPDSGAINVGALSDHSAFRRSTYTNFGPTIDVFAPGDDILSSYGNTGFPDSKYGSGNYYYPIQGTSMASPQVCGIVACLASNSPRFDQKTALGLISKLAVYDDMTFNVSGGALNDNTCQFGSPNKYLHLENPRPSNGLIQEQRGERTTGQTFPRVTNLYTSSVQQAPQVTITVEAFNSTNYTFSGDFSGNDPTITCSVGDQLVFNLGTGVASHPFWIKTQPSTGTGFGVTTGILTPANGQTAGTMIWDTTGVIPATYWYICQFHGGMAGQIVVS